MLSIKKVLFSLAISAATIFQSNAQCNKAITFDGANDYLSTTFEDFTYSALTMEVWVKLERSNSANNEHIISLNKGVTATLGTWNSASYVSMWADGTSPDHVNSISAGTQSEWHHVVFVYDGSNHLFYIDGQLDSNTSSVTGSLTLANVASGLVLGARFDESQQYLLGSIDEVRIWNVARTAQEIQDNMNTELFGTHSGLVAYYKFNEGTGTSVTDFSGNGNDLVFNNMDANTAWVDGPSAVNTVDLEVSVDAGTLTSSAENVTYQWLNCDNGNAVIDGATSASYSPFVSGNYAVQITNGTCVDTTDCYSVTALGLEDDLADMVTVSPNPSSDQFTFTFEQGLVNELEVVIYNARGQVVYETKASKVDEISIDQIKDTGLYFAVLYIDNKRVTYKLYKKN